MPSLLSWSNFFNDESFPCVKGEFEPVALFFVIAEMVLDIADAFLIIENNEIDSVFPLAVIQEVQVVIAVNAVED